jgi:hypothetical protein
MAGFFGLGSLIPHSRPPLLMRLVGGFICTCFAPHRQSVIVAASFIKVTLGLPALAPSTSLLFHPVNNSMALLVSIICFQAPPLFLVTLSHICPHAVFAPISQSVFVLTILAKLNFVFPLFAFGTAFLLHAINGPMALFIYEVSFQRPPIFPVISAFILTGALFAPQTQPVLAATILTKLTLVFPLFAFCTLLHFCLSVYVLLLIPDSQIGQQ